MMLKRDSALRMLRRVTTALAGGATLLAVAASADAQTTSATVSAFAEGFVPVPGGQPNTENVSASLLVIAAYAAFAIGFVGYLVHLARQQGALAREIQSLGRRLSETDGE